VPYEVTRYGIDDLDRAIADSEDEGFVKVLTVPGRDRILGATIVSAHAGDLLTEFILAMKHGLGLNKILGTIHIYPTMSEANRFLASEWRKARKPERRCAGWSAITAGAVAEVSAKGAETGDSPAWHGWYVYVLRCGDGSLYTGVARDVERVCASTTASWPAARATPGAGARWSCCGASPAAIAARAAARGGDQAPAARAKLRLIRRGPPALPAD
jgi:hypothetical protein